jgi:hypothetical protein
MLGAVLLMLLGLAQQPPAPRPFPGSAPPAQPPQQSKPAPPTAEAAPPVGTQTAPPTVLLAPPDKCATPTEAMLGIPNIIYPGSQFLTCYDAGRGQKFYLFGSASSFLDLVKYYRTVLKRNGELVFDAPATHEFEIRFREETMAFPQGVTIKEYKSAISEGYPNPLPGGQPARFPTIIQIVPVTPEK